MPALLALLERIDIGFNTAEIVKPDPNSRYNWSYQVKPGERHFREPVKKIIEYLKQNTELELLILED